MVNFKEEINKILRSNEMRVRWGNYWSPLGKSTISIVSLMIKQSILLKSWERIVPGREVNSKTENDLPHLRNEPVEEMPQCGRMKKWCVRSEWHTVRWERQAGARWCTLKPMWSSLRVVSHSHRQKRLKINSVLNLVISKKSSSSIFNLNFSNFLYPFRLFQSYN